MDGDWVIVGAPEYDGGGVNNIGESYFFERQPDETWKRWTPDATPATRPGDKSGSAVGISGDWAIIGAPFTDEACPQVSSCNSGSAFIYRRKADSSKWEKHQTLLPPGQAASQLFNFGSSVAIAGDIAVVGARRAPQGPFFDAGAAYVFRRNDAGTPGDLTDDVWVMEAPLAADDAFQNSFFNPVR